MFFGGYSMRSLVFTISVILFSAPAFTQSNPILEQHFKKDQESRSPENFERKIFPTFKDEIGRRIFVFEAISNNELVTAEDFFRASVILQHTNVEYVGEQLKSVGNENHLLAHFLAKRAFSLGHKNGAWLMAATYNRYLENADFDVEKYGLNHRDNQIFVNDTTISNEDRVEKGLIAVTPASIQ